MSMEPLATGEYTQDQIIAALHMSGASREVSYRYELLDKNDALLGELNECTGSVSNNAMAEIKRTASFVVRRDIAKDIDWHSERIKPYYRLKMPGGYVEWPLGVFLADVPAKTVQNNKLIYDVTGYDKAQILKEDCVLERYAIASGINYVTAITQVLNNAGVSKTNITPSDKTLESYLEFEPYTNKLSIINTLLAALNYNSLEFDAMGYAIASPYIEPQDREIEYTYRTDSTSVIMHNTTRGINLFNIPNVFVRYVSTPSRVLVSTVTNDDVANPLSTVSRGRSIVDAQAVHDIADQATLDAYTRRQAIEAMRVFESVEWSTAAMPHHTNLNCIYLQYNDFVSEILVETEWSLTMAAGAGMKHRARKVVRFT